MARGWAGRKLKWERWFAWRPVTLGMHGRTAWFEWVRRRKVTKLEWRGGLGAFYRARTWRWEYRE